MASYFVDSSALLKRYVAEAGTEQMVALVEGPDRLVVSRLAVVELTSAVMRRARAGGISSEQVDAVLSACDVEFRERFEVVDLVASVMSRATDIVRIHGLRAPDAIQLACALLARGEHRAADAFTLVSADRELNAAAERENLPVIDPTES